MAWANPGTTPSSENDVGVWPQLWSKTSPVSHCTPWYCTVTVAASGTVSPSPFFSTATCRSAGASVLGMATVGVPSSASVTWGSPAGAGWSSPQALVGTRDWMSMTTTSDWSAVTPRLSFPVSPKASAGGMTDTTREPTDAQPIVLARPGRYRDASALNTSVAAPSNPALARRSVVPPL